MDLESLFDICGVQKLKIIHLFYFKNFYFWTVQLDESKKVNM